MSDGHGVHSENIPGTYRPVANKDNDYLIDREAQKRGDTYSGVEGIAMQDASLQESMGPIVDRTKERLVLGRQRHHQGPPEAAQGRDGAARRGRRRRPGGPGPPPGALGGGRAAPGASRSWRPAATTVGARGRAAVVGLTCAMSRPILGSSCARAASARSRATGSTRPIAPARAHASSRSTRAPRTSRASPRDPGASARFYTCDGPVGAVGGRRLGDR